MELKRNAGGRGKKNKNKHLTSSKDAGETKQPPPTQTTGGEAILTNGIADDEKVLQEVVESDIVPVSASAAALLSAAPATQNSGNQNGKLPENEMGLSLEFIDSVIDSASNQEPKEADSRRDAEKLCLWGQRRRRKWRWFSVCDRWRLFSISSGSRCGRLEVSSGPRRNGEQPKQGQRGRG